MASRPSSASVHITSALLPLADWLRARGVFYCRRARIVRCEALQSAAEEPAIGVEVEEASDEDLRQLAAVRGVQATEWIARKASGTVCLLARSGPTPLGYLWITRAPEVMSEVNHVLDVSRDPCGAYMFDGYVLPPHRRKGILLTLLNRSKRWALQRGISRLYAAFARENRVSEHALRKAGFTTIVGDVAVVRVFRREWKWIRLPRGPPIADVLRADGPPRSTPRPT